MSHAELNEDFVDMLRALLDARVEFLIVGAHALAAHGIARATGDIDVFVNPTHDNGERVIAALRAFGAPIAAHGITAADFTTAGQVYQIGLPPRRIDLLTAISGVSFAEAQRDVLRANVAGLELPFIGRDALIANKRAAARPKDLLDVVALERADGR